MHIRRNHPADRDVARAWGDRQEETRRHDHPQDLIEADPRSSGNGLACCIELDPIKRRQLDHGAVFQLGGIAVGAAQTAGDQRPRRCTTHQLLQLLHAAGLHHLGRHWIGAPPTHQGARLALEAGGESCHHSLEATEAGRRRTSSISGAHHQGRYSMPRLFGRRSRSRATDSGLAHRAGGALPTVIGVAMNPALMIRTENGLPWQRSSRPSQNAVSAALAAP